MKNWRLIGLFAASVLAVTFAAGYYYGSYRTLEPEILIGEKYRVVRTPGGMLEVATFQKQETFAWQVEWDCPLNMCNFLPSSRSEISGVAHYTYRIPLAEYWVLEKLSHDPLRYQLKVPKLEAQLPVTVVLSTIRISNSGSVFAPSGPTQQKMQNYMQPQMAKRALSAAYVQAQQADATKTIVEFARKWMRDGDVKLPDSAQIEVVF
ncbi:MAG: hypothetical protein RLZZ612_754 [Pseudomonadota bacterium]|jgi:hypothetical protein